MATQTDTSRTNRPDKAVGAFAFPPGNRVLSRAHYQRVFDDNYRSSDAFFAVLAGRPLDGRRRLGITVSKKVSKKAVERNRIKRTVREVFRHLDDALPSADYVVIARARCAGSSNDAIRQSLERHFKKLESPQRVKHGAGKKHGGSRHKGA